MILFMVFLFLINGINSMVRVFVLFDKSSIRGSDDIIIFDKSSISGSDEIIINGIYSTEGRKRRGRLWERVGERGCYAYLQP